MVYIDANVFAYRLLPGYSNQQVRQATDFFLDIEIGQFQGTLSSFTEQEFRGVAKKMISKAKSQSISPQEEQTAMQDLEEFINRLGLIRTDSDQLNHHPNMQNIFAESNQMLIPAQPKLRQPKNEWRAIGASDAILISLAIRSGADHIATFDFGFKGMVNSTISLLYIPEEY